MAEKVTMLIEQYIRRHVVSAIGVICLMLIGLQFFMLLVGELNAIGTGSYKLFDAFIFVLLQLPFQLYLFFPVACLLGVLMGLGMMANHSELLVIRACGVSPRKVAVTVFKSVGILVVIVCFLGELAFPKLIGFSEDFKNNLKNNGQSLQTENGLWLRHDDSFIHINNVVSSHHLEGINQYQFNKNHELILARSIKNANFIDNSWQLSDVSQTSFSDDLFKPKSQTEAMLTLQDNMKLMAKGEHRDQMKWELNLSPNMLLVTNSDPNQMSLVKLGHLILAKRGSQLDAGNLEMNFWRRIFQPIATFVMVLLALPFAFGSVRHMTVGQRFLLGSSVGFLFHLLNEFVVPVSQIYQIPPLLAASMPLVIFALLGSLIIQKLT